MHNIYSIEKSHVSDLIDYLVKAQILAHRLGKLVENDIPKDLKDSLKEHRRLLSDYLLVHVNKEISARQNKVNKLENSIKQIYGLGGVPTQETLDKLEKSKSDLDELVKRDKNTILDWGQ